MKTCPKCGNGLWTYNASTLTCKLGHHHPSGEEPERFVPKRQIPLTVVGALSGGFGGVLVVILGHLL